jgi:hypothetical protein
MSSSIVARVHAIKAALGLPESVDGALPIVGAANIAMGIEPGENATLPMMIQVLEGAIGLQTAATAATAAADTSTAAAADSPAAPAPAKPSTSRGKQPAPSSSALNEPE